MLNNTSPFRQYVVKVASRCDLSCDHCYVYEAADASWRDKPRFITDVTMLRIAGRIAEHAAAHRLPAVQVVLHGGEPLLAGTERLRFAMETLRTEIESVGAAVDLRIHTNGVRLDDAFCELFRKYEVKVGVSLDGDKASNDLHRRFANGASSYPHVQRALALLRGEYRDVYSGVLCTIDIRNDPAAVYEAVKAADPPRADFLLPHATHSVPPLRLDQDRTEYADWLLKIYDLWVRDGRPFGIRTFDSVRAALRGLPSGTESLGLEPVDLVVVEADGTLEQVDSLKVTHDGAPETGFDVFANSFDEAAAHPGFVARQGGLADLCETCRACPVVGVCGGGLRTHRYKAPDAADLNAARDPFNHPSVFCADLKALIMDIKTRGAAEAATKQANPAALGLPEQIVDELAHGFGGADAVAHLTRFQRSLRRLLLAKVFAAADGVDGRQRESVDAAIETLKVLDRTSRPALSEVLAHPYVRVWALRCLDGVGTPGPGDFGHLGAIAAAAAIRAGVDAEVEVPILGGAVHLPSLGRLVVRPGLGTDAGTQTSTVTVRVEGGVCSLTAAREWQAVRSVAMADFAAGRVVLEDTDPYRDSHHWAITDRLPDAEAGMWLDTIPAAWDILVRDHADYAPAIAAGLSTIVPMAPSESRNDVSSTARHAYGAIGACLPVPRFGRVEPDAATLALLFIHEFQHGKLGAVMDMADLHDPSDKRLFEAPWRPDPRPLEGLLQGTYAHVGVTDYWRVRRFTAPGEDERAQADAEFRRWLGHTVRSVEVLAESGSLTVTGLRFADAMRETLEPWQSEASLAIG